MKVADVFHRLQEIEGERLCLLRAADRLLIENASTDLGPATRPLQSEALFQTTIPDDVVLQVAAGLRLRARALEAERDRLLDAQVVINGEHAATDTDTTVGSAPRRRVRAVPASTPASRKAA